MANHTPGPWEAARLKRHARIYVDVSQEARERGGPRSIASVCCDKSQMHQGEAEANARLIAAAPDLLAACEGCLAYLESKALSINVPDSEANDAADMTAAVRAALTKANGA